ncbi:FAD:protein FMN transferase [Lacticaseibacillus brantae]|uniref:FAD:protein FMN transferase n=1 Tax=Lacticaseibacillus brantae DSM 23927 TaxID=1423727 RepID=A0A0R2AW59_9LACO|nr:FAD:protein FMN transferase [Lacticaseibacillus brantae]KRM71485.1 thiamine biosynthesis lipoprotein [Lacticaseibacillus brantae DSM 23927]
MKKVFKTLLLLVAAVLLLVGCKQQATPKPATLLDQPYSNTEYLMGTVVTIRVYDKGKESALDDAFKRISQLADEITVNEKGSEIDAVNAQAGVKPVKVTPSIYKLIEYAKYFSDNSDGAFDLAIGPITSLWHIGFPDARKPSQSEIDARLPLVNYKNVELNQADQTVYLKQKGMQLDLGGIAKGFITDEVVKVLKKDQVSTAIIDLGGNLYVLGHSPKHTNANWTVGIQDPKESRGVALGTVPAANKTIVTSGIYERYLKVGNKTYMHLMNPKTGYPFDNNLMGVSIITDKSVDGDALSTATFDKGLKDGLAYIEKRPHTEAIFITKDYKVYTTSGLKDTFKLVKGTKYKLATLQ